MRFFTVFFLTAIFALTIFNPSTEAQQWKKDSRNSPVSDENFFVKKEKFEQFWAGKPIQRGKGWKQFKRWEWFAEQRVNAKGYMDPMATWNAFQAKVNSEKTLVADFSDWKNLGPQSAIPTDGGAGRLNAITFHPTNPNIIWVGAASGGLWKTTNGGLNWESNTDWLPVLGVSDIVIDPSNTNIMYIATGDGDALDNYSVGVLKSIDGGATWQPTGLNWSTTNTRGIRSLEINPSNPQILIAATTVGIFKSTDGGTNWANKVGGEYQQVEIDPNDTSVYYAAGAGIMTSSSFYGIQKSTNGGNNWTQLTTGLPSADSITRIELTISKSNSQIIYALISGLDYGLLGVYKSTNGGTTWTKKAGLKPNFLGWEANGSDDGGQGWYDLVIKVSPSNPDLVMIGGVNAWVSTNGGTNWNIAGHWYGDGIGYVHADHHALAFHPTLHNVIFSANDGGLFKTTNNGLNWTDLSNGLGIHQIYRLGVSKTHPDRIIVGAQDNGSSLLNTTWKNVLGGDGMECLIDYTNPNIMYGEYYYGWLCKSTNGGVSFFDINNGITSQGGWVTPYIIHPTNPNILFVGTRDVFKTTNGGIQWVKKSAINAELKNLAISSVNPNYVYANTTTGFYKSTNSGETWVKTTATGLTASSLAYITTHPKDSLTVYVTRTRLDGSGRILKSTNGGSTFTNITGDAPYLPVTCIAIDPQTTDFYIGTDLGVYYSSNETTWVSYNKNLPNVIVNELEISSSNKTLKAATYGRGVWESPLASKFVPVEFASIESSISGNDVVISWSTSTETNNYGFEVEKATESGWKNLGFVKGNNTTTERRSYSFKDRSVGSNVVKYRIKQIDFDGSISYSDELVVNFDNVPLTFSMDQNYPNPFNSTTNIRFRLKEKSDVSIKLYDVIGNEAAVLLNENKEQGEHTVQFNTLNHDLSSGIYFYTIKAGNYTETKKMVILK